MHQATLRALHRYRARRVVRREITSPDPQFCCSDNFTVTHANSAWLTDIAYTRTWQGWLFWPL